MKKINFKVDEVIVVLIVAFIVIAVNVYEHSNKSAAIEVEKITGLIFKDGNGTFANGGVIDENKLNKIKNLSYFGLKDSINAKEDFCLYLEDNKGNIIISKGLSKLSTDDLVCEE